MFKCVRLVRELAASRPSRLCTTWSWTTTLRCKRAKRKERQQNRRSPREQSRRSQNRAAPLLDRGQCPRWNRQLMARVLLLQHRRHRLERRRYRSAERPRTSCFGSPCSTSSSQSTKRRPCRLRRCRSAGRRTCAGQMAPSRLPPRGGGSRAGAPASQPRRRALDMCILTKAPRRWLDAHKTSHSRPGSLSLSSRQTVPYGNA
jgi:hypothetical protein